MVGSNLDERTDLRIFMSYATDDADLFEVPKIAEKLQTKPGIGKTLYWQRDMKENIREFMSRNIGECDIFVLFCSPNAINSRHVAEEWTAADQLGKYIIPVFTKQKYIPALLASRLGVEFDVFKKENTSEGIYERIKRKFPEIVVETTTSEKKPERIDLNRKYQYHMKMGRHYYNSDKLDKSLEQFREAKNLSKRLYDAELTIQVKEYISQVKMKIEDPEIKEFDSQETEVLEDEVLIDDEQIIEEEVKEEAEVELEEIKEGYNVLYVRISKIRELLYEGETKIRLSGDARESMAYYLDMSVHKGIKEIIERLPRISKGERKGYLKRITIQKEDFETPETIELENYQSKYIRVSKIRALLRVGNILIRVARDAWNSLIYYLDHKIASNINHLIENLPRKSKGEHIGELKRITIMKEDFDHIL